MNVQISLVLPDELHKTIRFKTLEDGVSMSTFLEETIEELISGRLEIEVTEYKFKATSTLIDHEIRDKMLGYAKQHGIPVNKLIRLTLEAKLRSLALSQTATSATSTPTFSATPTPTSPTQLKD